MAQVIELIPKIEPNITIKSQDLVLHVDYNLFCVALKNLLDNALNYSNDAHASLVVDGQNITISKQGEPLKYPLENYHEPYCLGDKKSKESRGLGFGLYIALEVFRLHHTICTYTHQNGQSIFKINIKSIL